MVARNNKQTKNTTHKERQPFSSTLSPFEQLVLLLFGSTGINYSLIIDYPIKLFLVLAIITMVAIMVMIV